MGEVSVAGKGALYVGPALGAPPLTLAQKRAVYTALTRRNRADLMNRSALSMVAGG